MDVLDSDLDIVDDLADKGSNDALTSLVIVVGANVLSTLVQYLSVLKAFLFGGLGSRFVFLQIDF